MKTNLIRTEGNEGNKAWNLILRFLCVLLLILLPVFVFAQEPAPAAAAAQTAGALSPLVEGLLGKFGWLTQVVLVMGSLRLVFKPIMVAWHNYVAGTASAADDAALEKFERGPIYKTVSFVLDWGASIKLKK